MNTNKLLIALAVVVAMVVVVAGPVVSQSISTIAKGYPAATLDRAITGFTAPATPTITLGNTAVAIGTMPAGTVAVSLVASGAFNYGDSAVKNSGTGAYLTVADKGSVTIPIWPGKLAPSIYVCNNATGETPIVRIVAHTQR